MENNLLAFAKDNTIRVSPLKIANVARLIVNLKANIAVTQLKFSGYTIYSSQSYLTNQAQPCCIDFKF